MSRDSIRWFTNPGQDALRTAFKWFVGRIAASPARRGLLVIPGKDSLEGHIEDVLGTTVRKELQKNKMVRFQEGTIELMTQQIRCSAWAGPVLAVFPTTKLLDRVDSLQGATEIVVVPWIPDEIVPWIKMWNARELGSTAEPSPTQFSNPTVQAALEALTDHINVSTGLVHPSDRAAAIEMFRLLHKAGEPFDPAEVRAWLVSELKWQPRHANAVQEVATKVLEGRPLRVSRRDQWASDVIEQWRARGQPARLRRPM